MSFLRLGSQDGLYYEHHLPADDGRGTFVFFNALTGDTAAWEAVICPTLRDAGYGTLTYNMRGQVNSPFSPGVELGEKQIVADAVKLLSTVAPAKPILVGLSIGGLFAIRAWLAGAEAIGLALINTLRRDGLCLKRITAITMMTGAIGLWLVVGLFWRIWVNPATIFSRVPEQMASLLTLGFWNTPSPSFCGSAG